MSPPAKSSPAARPSAGPRASPAPKRARKSAAARGRAEPEQDGRSSRVDGRPGACRRARARAGRARRRRAATASLLAAGEPFGVAVRARECEHGDPGGADGLDERERREAQRGDVDEPAGGLGCEAAQPASVAEQERDEPARVPRREPRHRRRGVVLARVRPVDRDRRDQREREAERRAAPRLASRRPVVLRRHGRG